MVSLSEIIETLCDVAYIPSSARLMTDLTVQWKLFHSEEISVLIYFYGVYSAY